MHTPPGFDPFDKIAYYALKTVLLILFFYGLFEVLRIHLHF